MYTPLQNKTHYSFQIAYSKVDELVKKCVDYNIPSLALTDNILSNSIKLYENCKKAGIKPIYGVNLVTSCGINLLFYSMNHAGYLELIRLSNKNQAGKIDLDDVKQLKNVIVVSSDSYSDELVSLAKELDSRFYVGVNMIGRPSSTYGQIRDFSCREGLRVVALNESLYSEKTDKYNHLTLLCSSLKKTYQEIIGGTNNEFVDRIVNNDGFHLQSPEEFGTIGYTAEEMSLCGEISSRCESFSVLGKLSLPSFGCENEPEYLRELCRDGWKRKIANKIPSTNHTVYLDRIKHELSVIEQCGLSGYFNIVQDYINWAKNKDILVGPGRGSVGGSLIAYLTNITEIDPIKYNLVFERFFNIGRRSADRVSLPDIDTDFPISNRIEVIDYIRSKYGNTKVCQVATFGSLKGRGALKEVMRIHSVCDEKTANEITKNIPQEGAISDKLEEDKENSIVRWTLNNMPNVLKDWCTLENNEYIGPMADTFKQSVTMEGTFKSYGKHASALIISSNNISESYQMFPDKSSDETILGVEYEDGEKSGLCKMDILGLSTLSKLMSVKNLLKYGTL